MCSSVYKLNIILSNHAVEIYIEQNALFSRIRETICIQNKLRVNICISRRICKMHLFTFNFEFVISKCNAHTHIYTHIVPVNL